MQDNAHKLSVEKEELNLKYEKVYYYLLLILSFIVNIFTFLIIFFNFIFLCIIYILFINKELDEKNRLRDKFEIITQEVQRNTDLQNVILYQRL